MSRRGNGEGAIFPANDRPGFIGMLDLGTGPDGKRIRRKVRGKTKTEVGDKLRAIRREHEGRPATTRTIRTVGELAKAWLTVSATARLGEDSTMLEQYRTVVASHIVKDLGPMRLDRVSAEDVDRWLVAKAEAGYARSSVRRYRNTLSQVFRWGVRRRHCTWDPASFAELPPASAYEGVKPKAQRRTRALNREESAAFIAAALDRRDRYKRPRTDGVALVVALCTGLRPGELLALHWEDLDLDAGRVHVHRAWKGHDEHRQLGPPKTAGSVRTVGLPEVAAAALRRHKRAQAAARLKAGPRWCQEWPGLVFTTSTGTPVHPANFRRLVSEVATAAGVGKHNPYDLRHTAASLLSEAGVLNHDLADLLGHTTTRMVEVHYRHRLSESVDVAVAPMRDLFGTG